MLKREQKSCAGNIDEADVPRECVYVCVCMCVYECVCVCACVSTVECE